MVTELIVFVSVLIVISVILIFYHPLSTKIEKILFRRKVARKVYRIAKNGDYYLLNKVAITVEGKTIHFDHLIFGDKYIYCIGANYYPLAISGKVDDSSWFQYKRNNKFVFIRNPMKLHRERVNYFSSLISSSSDLFVATIVVNDSCLLPEIGDTFGSDRIVNLGKLEQMIRNYEKNPDVDPIEPVRLHRLVLDVYKNGVDK